MKTNLHEWRNSGGLREQLTALEESIERLEQDNEMLREKLDDSYEELAEEVGEEIREKYEELVIELKREAEKWKERYEMAASERDSAVAEMERQQHDADTRMSTLRQILGCTVNNIEGNYIENQKIH